MKYLFKIMKYLFKHFLTLVFYLSEGIFWFAYAIISIFIVLGYFIWNLKIPKKPMAKIDKRLQEIIKNEEIFKSNAKILRIILGGCTLAIILLILACYWIKYFIYST